MAGYITVAFSLRNETVASLTAATINWIPSKDTAKYW